MITGILHKTTAEHQNSKTANLPHDVRGCISQDGLFFYIGENLENAQKFYGIHNAHAEADFEKAKLILDKFHVLDLVPSFILIDLPFREKELCNFILWLHSARWSSTIPVIYNITDCSFDDIRRLEEINVTDELADIRERFEPAEVVEEPVRQRTFRKRAITGKRIFDIMVSGSVLLMLSPLFLLISLMIKIMAKGPVMCKVNYVGQHFRVFPMYRFRTPGCGVSERAKRPNPFEAFLTKTYLNKLPLFINVLKGDMSIVGNRPLPLHEASKLTDNKHSERFNAPAGITGLMQITGKRRNNLNEDEKMWLDIIYARQQGLAMDFQIIMETPLAMFKR
ncbi:MAG: sugar transferase [Chitinophagaceae bacterium]|nr:sugar transferase [Chitinophagaceae bacterium]